VCIALRVHEVNDCVLRPFRFDSRGVKFGIEEAERKFRAHIVGRERDSYVSGLQWDDCQARWDRTGRTRVGKTFGRYYYILLCFRRSIRVGHVWGSWIYSKIGSTFFPSRHSIVSLVKGTIRLLR